MQSSDIHNTLRSFIGDFVNTDDLDNGTDIFASGFVNSLFAMQLLLFIEQTFSFQVESEDMDIANFRSIDAMHSFILRKKGS